MSPFVGPLLVAWYNVLKLNVPIDSIQRIRHLVEVYKGR